MSLFHKENKREVPRGHWENPQAEWHKAGEILMHTPGPEAFDAVIHPAAGLYEDYFDAEKVANEHRDYIRRLKRKGIVVHTVRGILEHTDTDRLRTIASHVLTYDGSHLPNLDVARMEDYRREVLYKMSRTDLIRCILLRPTVTLYESDRNTGMQGAYSYRPLMNLYFTRDQSINTPKGLIICQMNSEQRAPETEIITLCYERLRIYPILKITGEGRLEGGDYFPSGDVSFIGCGMRTNDEGIRQIMEADAFGHDTVVVVRDHKFWQKQMHLDTWFNLIDKDLCTMVASRLNARKGQPEFGTCDIWKRESAGTPYRCVEKDKPFVDYLRENGFQIIPIGPEDEEHYANNFLTVAPRSIMAVAGQSRTLERHLSEAGVRVDWVPLENCIKGYGAAHCMTQVLQRRP